MKIWAKTINEDKITRNVLYECEYLSCEDDFVTALQNICEQMDIPTPIVTRVNFDHFGRFNNTKFRPRDFVESVDFQYFDVEAVPDDKKSDKR